MRRYIDQTAQFFLPSVFGAIIKFIFCSLIHSKNRKGEGKVPHYLGECKRGAYLPSLGSICGYTAASVTHSRRYARPTVIFAAER